MAFKYAKKEFVDYGAFNKQLKEAVQKFREAYSIDENGRFGHYKSGNCKVCGKSTTQVDATMLWDGIVTHLCSDECHDAYWSN